MLLNRQKEQNSFYQRISLPKTNNPANKSYSTRCISVNKTEAKPVNLNKVVITKQCQPLPKPLTYFLGKGNNEGVVRKVLACRATWNQSEDSTSAFINLKWQQDQKGFKYERLIESGLYRSIVNCFEFHQALSNKEFLFRNLQKYCQKNNLDLWKIVPPTYILNLRDQCNMMQLKQFTETYERNYPKKLREKGGSQTDTQIQQNKVKLRRIFYNSNLKKILPKPPPINKEFLDEQGEYLWIVKPTFLNRGRGIQVFSKLESLYKFVSENIGGYVQKSLSAKQEEQSPTRVDFIKRNSEQIHQSVLLRDPANRQIRQKRQESYFDGNQYIRVIPKGPSIIKTDKFLIQKYLEKPMLIKSRKFDIRIWVLVTYNMKGYVFKEGYVRLSSLAYTCTDSPQNNTFMHLTNNAVQKFSEGYGTVVDGNQMSFKELKEEMQNSGFSFEECMQKIHEHIRISLKATIKLLNPMSRKHCFQLFGYDFMIDQIGYPWLIEVNNNPCLQESSKLLQNLLPRVLDDAFKLTLDPLFYGSASSGKFHVEDYPDNANMWQNINLDLK